jgi:hypothetical protein
LSLFLDRLFLRSFLVNFTSRFFCDGLFYRCLSDRFFSGFSILLLLAWLFGSSIVDLSRSFSYFSSGLINDFSYRILFYFGGLYDNFRFVFGGFSFGSFSLDLIDCVLFSFSFSSGSLLGHSDFVFFSSLGSLLSLFLLDELISSLLGFSFALISLGLRLLLSSRLLILSAHGLVPVEICVSSVSLVGNKFVQFSVDGNLVEIGVNDNANNLILR